MDVEVTEEVLLLNGKNNAKGGSSVEAGNWSLAVQGGAEISSKMCNISNSHGRARKARLGNLRSEGYEMGLAKGRAFSAKRSVGHFRVGTEPSAIPKKCEITMEG